MKKTLFNSDDTENDGTSRRNFLGGAAIAGIGLIAALVHRITSNTQEQNAPPQSGDTNSVLIAYLTRTKNTQAVAEIIQQEVGRDMMEVKPAEPYPEDYDAIVAQVDEENESGYTPPLKSTVENMQAYDTVLFGFPTWDMQLPPPMKTFLREHDLGRKTVVPFNTNGGYGVGNSFQTIADRCPNSDVLEGFSTKGGLERDGIYLAIKGERREEVHAAVTDWLQRIQV